METALIDKIKSHGYWLVKIRPTYFEKKLISSLAECRRLIRESNVSLRGCDYPHMEREGEGLISGIDWIESSTDWGKILEYWRFYQSGQFAHVFNCREDWVDLNSIRIQRFRNEPLPGRILDMINTIYRTTEIYEFTARLAAKNIFGNDLQITVELHGMKSRTLVLTDPSRGPLDNDYTCRLDDLPYSKTVTVETMLAEPSELALENILYFFERFNWDRIPIEVIKEAQRRFLERRW
jgi:hypothetical protein